MVVLISFPLHYNKMETGLSHFQNMFFNLQL